MRGGLLHSATIVAIGSIVSGVLFWALLNVPESNAFAVVLSAAIAVLIVVSAGLTTASAEASTHQPSFALTVRRAVVALPSFVIGLVLFAALWWLTDHASVWWHAHQGEIDAMFLRHFGTTRTAWLHASVYWILWLLRWGLGLSIVAALPASATRRGVVSIGAGVRLSVRLFPLAAVIIAVLVAVEGLWRVVYWRPAHLPANTAEVVFAGAKLSVLFVAAVLLTATVLRVFGRAARN